MTVEQVHIQLNLRIDKIDSSAYDHIQPEEADVYLNAAMKRFIKERYELRSNRFQLGFEQSTKRIEDLRHLLKESPIDVSYNDLTTIEGTFIDEASFPQDYYLPVKGSVVLFFNEDGIDFTVITDKRNPVGVLDTDYGKRVSMLKYSQQHDIHAIATAPFNGTRIKSPLYVMQGTSLNVISDNTFIPDKVNLTYIRQPETISLSGNQSIDLPDFLHDEVIDLAARMILSDINAMTPSKQQTLAKVE